jgi:O-antigen ligase
VKQSAAPWLLIAAFAAYPALHVLVFDVRPLFGVASAGSLFVQPKFHSAMVGGALALLALLLSGGRTPLASLLASFRSAMGVAWWIALVGFATAPLLATEIPTPIGYLGFIFRADGALLMIATLLIMAAYARYAFLFPMVGRATLIGFTVGAMGVGIVALLQSLGVDVFAAFGILGVGTNPPRSTTGSHGFASAIAGVGTMLLIGLSAAPRWRVWNRSTAIFVAALAVMALVTAVAGGRSAILGVIVALVVWIVRLAWRAVRDPSARRPLAIVGVAVLAIAAGTAINDFSGRRLGDLVERLVVAPTSGDDVAPLESVDERLLFWRIALRLVADQPLLPYGSGAFTKYIWEGATPEEELALISFRRPRVDPTTVRRQDNTLFFQHPRTGERVRYEAVIDKAHNYVLDLWLAFGAVPTLAMVALLILLLVALARAGTPVTWAIALGMIAYGVYAMAWFVGTAVEPALYALLGAGWGAVERVRRGVPATHVSELRPSRAALRRGRA